MSLSRYDQAQGQLYLSNKSYDSQTELNLPGMFFSICNVGYGAIFWHRIRVTGQDVLCQKSHMKQSVLE